ncbi:MAG: hypothetical protein QM501_13990 [Gimesia sp.]
MPDQTAGRKGTCNTCGNLILIPTCSVAPPVEAIHQRSDDMSSMPGEVGKKKSLGKSLIAIFVCLFLLMNTPFAPLPFLVVSLFCIAILVLTGVVETPKLTLNRKRQETDEEAHALSRYRNLSDEGKLIYELQKKQAGTERYTRGIFWFLMSGVIGFIFFWLIGVLAADFR